MYQQTDEWFQSYIDNYTKIDPNTIQGMTLFEYMVHEYIGDPRDYSCTIGDVQVFQGASILEGNCRLPGCTGVNTTLSSVPGFRQAYLVLAGWEGSYKPVSRQGYREAYVISTLRRLESFFKLLLGRLGSGAEWL